MVDADLSRYFDSIPHAELLKSVARRIVDRHVLRLIKLWLKAPIEEQDGDEGTGNVAWSRCCDTRRRKGETTGNTNIDLNRRASPRPYLGAPGGEIPPGDSTNAAFQFSANADLCPLLVQ